MNTSISPNHPSIWKKGEEIRGKTALYCPGPNRPYIGLPLLHLYVDKLITTYNIQGILSHPQELLSYLYNCSILPLFITPNTLFYTSFLYSTTIYNTKKPFLYQFLIFYHYLQHQKIFYTSFLDFNIIYNTKYFILYEFLILYRYL